jgi:hypothetical protein
LRDLQPWKLKHAKTKFLRIEIINFDRFSHVLKICQNLRLWRWRKTVGFPEPQNEVLQTLQSKIVNASKFFEFW